MAAVEGANVWKNADGLRVRFGTEQSRDAKEGSPAQKGPFTTMTFQLDSANLPLFGDTADRYLNRVPTCALPNGALIRSATIIVTTAFTGTGATLTLGLAEQDGTIIDADGIDAAIALTALDAVGEEVACDGALIDTKLTADGYLIVDVGTASFTAGKATLVIELLIEDAL